MTLTLSPRVAPASHKSAVCAASSLAGVDGVGFPPVVADAPVGESYGAFAVRLASAVAGSFAGASVALHSESDDWGCSHVMDGNVKRFSIRCRYDNLMGVWVCECVDCYVVLRYTYESKSALFADFDRLVLGLVDRCKGLVYPSWFAGGSANE